MSGIMRRIRRTVELTKYATEELIEWFGNVFGFAGWLILLVNLVLVAIFKAVRFYESNEWVLYLEIAWCVLMMIMYVNRGIGDLRKLGGKIREWRTKRKPV